jgi:large subunit ribosomal protein L18
VKVKLKQRKPSKARFPSTGLKLDAGLTVQ